MRFLISSLFSLFAIQGVAEAGPVLTFSVSKASFDTLAVFESGELIVQVFNTGDSSLVVTDVAPSDSVGAFSVAPSNFTVDPSDSLALTITFAPAWAGSHIGALLFTTDADVPGNGIGGLLAEGIAAGPRLQPGAAELLSNRSNWVSRRRRHFR